MGTTYPAIYKKLRIFSRFFTGRPVWCTWQVTYRCNFNCSFCDYWKCAVKPTDELSLDQIRTASRNLAQISSLMISIGGGEPFMRPDLPLVIEAMARYHMPLLTTNGWFVTPYTARNVFKAGLWGASVSLDYASEKMHDCARGVKGAFKRALTALEYLSNARTGRFQRVNMMAVLMKDNIDQIEPLIRLAGKYGAFFMVQPYCSIKAGKQEFTPNMNVGRRLIELRRKYDNFISNEYFLERFDLALDGGVPGCKAAQLFFNIDNFGRVAKCVEDLENPLGDVLTDTAKTLSTRLKTSHRENTCRACWYNCRGEIEALYNPRGFLNAMPVVLSTWSRTKKT